MIQIKKFTFTNKNLIKKAFDIRHKVFVIEQKCPPEIEYEFEEESTHFLVINNTKPVAAARHRKTNIGYKLERFAVLKEERGKKYGYMILEAILIVQYFNIWNGKKNGKKKFQIKVLILRLYF